MIAAPGYEKLVPHVFRDVPFYTLDFDFLLDQSLKSPWRSMRRGRHTKTRRWGT